MVIATGPLLLEDLAEFLALAFGAGLSSESSEDEELCLAAVLDALGLASFFALGGALALDLAAGADSLLAAFFGAGDADDDD
jgi:uncharacterized membrane protein YeiH